MYGGENLLMIEGLLEVNRFIPILLLLLHGGGVIVEQAGGDYYHIIIILQIRKEINIISQHTIKSTYHHLPRTPQALV